MLTQRLKILIALVISFTFVEGYTYFSQNPTVIPTQAENIKGLLSNIKFNPLSFTRLFTLQFSDNNNLAQVNSGSTGMNGINNGVPPVYVTPTKTIKPTNIIGSGNPTPTAFVQPTRPIQPSPTNTPKPTIKPKPTKPPAVLAVTSDQRPGSTLGEIFADVSKRECIPAALLRAFQMQETGPWWPYESPSSKVKIYNKYGWWLDGTGNSCTGMGYHTSTGVVPSDAADAGAVCQNALGGYDQGIMGIIQISQEEEDAAKKYITNVIKGNIDRRVLFDNAVIFAIITKNRLGDPPTNCNDWPDDAIQTAAEKHQGNCSNNYCANILKYYKEYR